MIAPDDWSVGIWVISMRGPRLNNFDPLEKSVSYDRSYSLRPLRVVAIDLPFVVLREGQNRCILNISEWQFKKLNDETVRIYHGGGECPTQ